MEKSGKRGKIPQSDWPLIMSRYEAGETLASIARTYDCSPPAISYVVSRSRTRQPTLPAVELAKPAPAPAEPQLLKAAPGEAAAGAAAAAVAAQPPMPEPAPAAADPETEPTAAEAAVATAPVAPAPVQPAPVQPPPVQPALRSNGHAEAPHRDAGGGHSNGHAPPRNGSLQFAPPAARPSNPAPNPPPNPPWQQHQQPPQQRPTQQPAANGDHRRTLHLSLGSPTHGQAPAQSNGHGNGYGHTNPPETAGRQNADIMQMAQREPDRLRNDAAPARPMPLPPHYAPNHHADAEPAGRKDNGGSFIDFELRTRVEGDITAFLAAFDAALAQDTQESRSGLREATDRLLRAGARTRIELERLEARVPLGARSGADRMQPAWRDR